MDHSPINLFSGTIDTLSRSLNLRARKHEMILNNVANADTPNYRPFTLDVSEALQQAADKQPQPSMQRTDARHLPGQAPPDVSTSRGRTAGDDPLLLRGDRNGVNIDAEMTALAKNSLLYKASAQLVASKFKGLKNVIKGGNQ